MVSGLPMLCSGISVGVPQPRPVHRTTSFTKLSEGPSSLMSFCPHMPATGNQSLTRRCRSKALKMSSGNTLAMVTKLDTMVMTARSLLSVPTDTKKLLPLLSTVLWYSVIASSTVSKLPQVLASSGTKN
jgi:hypothetical protein